MAAKTNTYDVAIIGAGIMGCMAARELARYDCEVLVLERNGDLGDGSTTANSGIIHTGFHARGGSLKGQTCVEGNNLYLGSNPGSYPSGNNPDGDKGGKGDKGSKQKAAACIGIAAELGVPLVRCGGLYNAFGPEGIETIRQKQERALQNGAGKLDIISGDAARAMEPRLSHKVIAALVAPTTSVISPFALLFATAQNAYSNGVSFRFNAGVERIEHDRSGNYLLHTTAGHAVHTRFVLNLAGDDAALMDSQVHPADLIVQPKLGQYLVFDKQGKEGIAHVLFQAGEDGEGGTLMAPTTDGNLLVGPTSQTVRSYRQNATTVQGLAHVRSVAEKLVPDIDIGQVITAFAGVRTNISNMAKEQKDFVLRASAPGFVSALGIKNPGMTCAPALVRKTIELLRNEGLELVSNLDFQPRQEPYRPFLQKTAAEQKALLAKDKSYGTVLCRCEHITEGDVTALLSQPLPPQTLDGLKRRLRTGMGRCQGAFCSPRIVALLAKACNVRAQDIRKGEQGGHLVAGSVK